MSDLHFIDPHPLVSRCVRKLFWLNKLICYTCASLYRLYALCFCHLALEVFVMVDKSKKFWNRKGLLEQVFQISWDLTHLVLLLLYSCLDHLPTNRKITSCKKVCSTSRQDIYGHWPLVSLIGWLRLPEKENTWPANMHLLKSHKLMKKTWKVSLHCYRPGWRLCSVCVCVCGRGGKDCENSRDP